MNRKYKIVGLEVLDYDEGKVIAVKISKGLIQQWCLELCLLHHDLVNSIEIAESKTFSVGIVKEDNSKKDTAKSHHSKKYSRGRAVWHPTKPILYLSKAELSYWVTFFLEHHRDGGSKVNHIDTELPLQGAEGFKSLSLILQLV